MKSFVNKKIFIESNEYTYRVEHLTLEGTCSTDHGPRNVKIKNLLVDKYPVTNQQYSFFLKKTGYKPRDSQRFLDHKPNKKKFPCLKLLDKIPNKISLFETALISSSDELVKLFLKKKINFQEIYSLLTRILDLNEIKKLKKKKTNKSATNK